MRVNEEYRSVYQWANPLLENGADAWYANEHWRELIFTAPDGNRR